MIDQYDPFTDDAPSVIWATQMMTFGLVCHMWYDMNGKPGTGAMFAALFTILGLVVCAGPMAIAAYKMVRGETND